jgi:orotidine-5'-phosphate decarboxylase
MMKAASVAVMDEAARLNINPPKLIGVTILTSINDQVLNDELKINNSANDQVVHLALMAKASGLNGVVASPLETRAIREACGKGFIIVTPGIRPSYSLQNDQKRIMTPAQAVASGTDIMVIGRPICSAKNPREAAERILEEILSND